jgi:hypothetical protein
VRFVHALVQFVHRAFNGQRIFDEAGHEIALFLFRQAGGDERHGAGVAFQIESVLPDVEGEHVLRKRTVGQTGDEGMDQYPVEDGERGLPRVTAPAARIYEGRQGLRSSGGHGRGCENRTGAGKQGSAQKRGRGTEEGTTAEAVVFHVILHDLSGSRICWGGIKRGLPRFPEAGP